MTGIAAQFLGATQIEAAIRETRRLAGRAKLVLAGGVAMQLYGSDRLTRDVNFLARRVPARIRVVKRLAFGGVSGTTPDGAPVCFIVRDDDYAPLYREPFVQSVKVKGFDVVSPEHLAAMKLVAGRTKDESDLLLLLMRGALDRRRARAIVRRHLGAYALDEFNARIEEAEWRKVRDARRDVK